MKMKELKNKRQENAKVFDIGGGERRVHVFSDPIHYNDGNEWKEIELAYETDGKSVNFTKLPYSVNLSDESGKTGKASLVGKIKDYQIDIDVDFIGVSKNPESEAAVFDNDTVIRTRQEALGTGQILFKIKEGHFDIEYEMYEDGDVPEGLIFNIRVSDSIEIKESSLKDQKPISPETEDRPAEYEEHPSYIEFHHETEGLVWKMDSPVIYEAGGGSDISYLNVESLTNSEIEISIELDKDWIRSPSAQYPVVLDPSFTSNQYNVSDGGSTSHTVPSDATSISNEEVRWGGISESGTTGTWSENYGWTSGSLSLSKTRTCPTVNTQAGWRKAEFHIDYRHNSDNGDYALNWSINTNFASPSGSQSYTSGDGDFWFYLQRVWANSNPAGQNGTGQVSLKNGNHPNDPILWTKWQNYGLKNVTRKTHDPTVTVSQTGSTASYTGDVGGGNWTGWRSINMNLGSNTFQHSISGSKDAKFQFTYTYISKPTAVREATVTIGSTSHRVALADPNDAALQYDIYRTYLDETGVLCFDVVDTSDSDSIGYYIYHPTHGKLALRKIV